MFGIKRVLSEQTHTNWRMDGLERELFNLTRILWQFRQEESEKWRIVLQNLQQYNDMIAALAAKVKSQTDIDTSAVALIQGLKAQINDLITRNDGIVDVSQLQNLASALDAGTKALADAVTANTAPAPAPAAAAPTPPVDAPAAPATGGEGQPASTPQG